MMRVRDLVNGRLPAKVGVCKDDPRLIEWINRAQERLLMVPGMWLGRTQTTSIWLADRRWFLLPPGAVAIVAARRPCGGPAKLANRLWRFSGACDPDRLEREPCLTVHHRDRAAMVQLPECAPFQVFAIARYAEDVGTEIRVEGLDENDNVVRSDDGEGIVISAVEHGHVDTPSTCRLNVVTDLVKGRTLGEIEIWARDAAGCEVLVNELYPADTSGVRELYEVSGGCGADEIEAVLRLGHVEVAHLNDKMVLENRTALELASESLAAEELKEHDRAESLFRNAVGALQQEAISRDPGRDDPLHVESEPGRKRSLERRYVGI